MPFIALRVLSFTLENYVVASDVVDDVERNIGQHVFVFQQNKDLVQLMINTRKNKSAGGKEADDDSSMEEFKKRGK